MIPPEPPTAAARTPPPGQARVDATVLTISGGSEAAGALGGHCRWVGRTCVCGTFSSLAWTVAGSRLIQKQLAAFCGRSSFLCGVYLEAQAGAPCSQSGEKGGRCRWPQQVHLIFPKFSQVPSTPWASMVGPLLSSPSTPSWYLLLCSPQATPPPSRNLSWHLPYLTPSS